MIKFPGTHVNVMGKECWVPDSYICPDCHADAYGGHLDWTKQCQSLNSQCMNFKEIIQGKSSSESKLFFLTIQDFQRRLPELDKLKHFIKKCEHIFETCIWCIESGSVEPPNSNLHIHMLARYHNSKKGKNMLCIQWSKLFNTNLRDSDFFHLKQHRDAKGMPSYKDWLQEKLDYFEDEKKGSHQNALDLGSRGAWGVSTSLL